MGLSKQKSRGGNGPKIDAPMPHHFPRLFHPCQHSEAPQPHLPMRTIGWQPTDRMVVKYLGRQSRESVLCLALGFCLDRRRENETLDG